MEGGDLRDGSLILNLLALIIRTLPAWTMEVIGMLLVIATASAAATFLNRQPKETK